MDNPRSPCDFAQRRKLCDRYERRWSNLGRTAKATHKLSDELYPHRHSITTHGGNLISFQNLEDNYLIFLRVPPVTSSKKAEQWSIPPFPFNLAGFDAYPPCNILAAAEVEEG